MFSSWNIRHDKQGFLLFWAIFCTLTLLTTWKIKILKKWKKCLKILSFYTCTPQMMIIWCMVAETWSATDSIFCHFGLFFALLLPPRPTNNLENQNFEKMKEMPLHNVPQMKTIWGMVLEIWSATIFFLILDHFLPSPACPLPPNNPENQNFEKMKNRPKDIIISHKFTINDNHMRYDSWDMKLNRQVFVILGHFLPFYPTNNPKNKSFEKIKKTWRYYHFTEVYQKS